MKNIVVLFLILLLSCTTSRNPELATDTSKANALDRNQTHDRNMAQTSNLPLESKMPLRKLENLWVIGNFDDDTKQDTLFEHSFSNLLQTEMDSVADPFQADWDSVVKWYYKQDTDIYLSFNQTQHDTLHLGAGIGLYFLINLGDLNKDGKDEIAVAVDYFDYSNLNSCKIYTLCKGKWQLMKQFDIFEGAFDYTNGVTTVFKHIEGYLEKQKGHWVYRDYMDYINAESTKDTVMQILKISKCQQ